MVQAPPDQGASSLQMLLQQLFYRSHFSHSSESKVNLSSPVAEPLLNHSSLQTEPLLYFCYILILPVLLCQMNE
jgi:hypothetical protein